MPQRTTGTVVWVPKTSITLGHWKARVRLADGSRPWLHYEDLTRREDEATARDRALFDSKTARDEGFALEGKPSAGLTCSKWWELYFTQREDKGQTSVRDARSRVAKWVAPLLGDKVMRDVTRKDLEDVVRSLDEAARRGEISPKTAGNIWGEGTSVFGAAGRSKDPALRVRDDNVCEKIEGPDGGVDRERPILYPSEATALLSCEAVPLSRRRAYAFALYTAARSNELAALTAADVDLEHARLSIAKQRDRYTDEDRKTKTRRARAFDIEPALLPLVELLCEERPDGRLLDLPVDEERARFLRADLAAAGVVRPELTTDDDMRGPMVFHGLRHTSLTWMGVRGDDPLRIQFRAGHSDFAMTNEYVAAGRTYKQGFGDPFPPLPRSVLGPNSDQERSESLKTQRPQRDLNPC